MGRANTPLTLLRLAARNSVPTHFSASCATVEPLLLLFPAGEMALESSAELMGLKRSSPTGPCPRAAVILYQPSARPKFPSPVMSLFPGCPPRRIPVSVLGWKR